MPVSKVYDDQLPLLDTLPPGRGHLGCHVDPIRAARDGTAGAAAVFANAPTTTVHDDTAAPATASVAAAAATSTAGADSAAATGATAKCSVPSGTDSDCGGTAATLATLVAGQGTSARPGGGG